MATVQTKGGLRFYDFDVYTLPTLFSGLIACGLHVLFAGGAR